LSTGGGGFGSDTSEGIFGELQHLSFDGVAISDDQLASVASLQHLVNLNLGSTAVTDAGLAHLSGLANLQSLDLSSTAIHGTGFRHLAGLTAITITSTIRRSMTRRFIAGKSLICNRSTDGRDADHLNGWLIFWAQKFAMFICRTPRLRMRFWNTWQQFRPSQDWTCVRLRSPTGLMRLAGPRIGGGVSAKGHRRGSEAFHRLESGAGCFEQMKKGRIRGQGTSGGLRERKITRHRPQTLPMTSLVKSNQRTLNQRRSASRAKMVCMDRPKDRSGHG
jgi:hypothetical protein